MKAPINKKFGLDKHLICREYGVYADVEPRQRGTVHIPAVHFEQNPVTSFAPPQRAHLRIASNRETTGRIIDIDRGRRPFSNLQSDTDVRRITKCKAIAETHSAIAQDAPVSIVGQGG